MHSISLLPFFVTYASALPRAFAPRAPTPFNNSTLLVGANPKDICGTDYTDPKKVWGTVNDENSPAKFLDDWIREHGSDNWLQEVDTETTSGSHPGSILNCDSPKSTTCPIPTLADCELFTPPELFHVRNAVALCHEVLHLLDAELQEQAFLTSLDINTIKDNFQLSEDAPSDIVLLINFLAGGFTAAAGLAAASAPLTGGATLIAGLFSLFGLGLSSGETEGDAVDVEANLEKRLQFVVATMLATLDKLSNTVFSGNNGNGGVDPESLFEKINGDGGESTGIGKFFSGGKFLYASQMVDGKKQDPNGVIQPIVKDTIQFFRQSLAIEALRSTGHYIFVDTTRSQDDCNTITGSRYINDECFTIEHKSTGPGPDGIYGPITEPGDADQLISLTNDFYQLSMETLYDTANRCYGVDPTYEGKTGLSELNFDGDLSALQSVPACFYNIPVIKGHQSPCHTVLAARLSCGPDGGSMPHYNQTLFDAIGFTYEECHAIYEGTVDVPSGTG
ncbi:hypothetical protein FQN54_000090 [Arachnomyces sp. PD_36]|nr:hypothetical protein FQN54_000090 [Arachnomyces sp. PD_36]